ncbi:chromate efflux transporter [Emcibacter sp. SYSU 3D8]|uniref:chromate efflux transporter n=1 Tax=Emcibacter sp. SYSU 3D8 TaxID=3133969 RepID=UPI0031FE7202
MTAPAPHVSFGEAFRTFGKIGLLSFGGPAGQIALMHRILVDEKKWVGEDRFLHALNFCMLLPGPEAQQLATYIGWMLHRTRGAIVAGLLFILPGFCVIAALSTAYMLFQQTTWIDTVFFGLKAAVLAIVVEALLKVARRALKSRAMVAVAALAFLALFLFKLPFPLVIAAAALAGYLAARIRPSLIALPSGHAGPAALMAVDARSPVQPTVRRALGLTAVWLAIWGSLPLLLVGLFGWDSVYAPIALFFSKMAVVTFGGAYAVLSYVAQEAVGTYAWLRPGEMLDGLALAETTPGPLIMVLTYVGFIAGFRDAAGLDPVIGGLIGALLATWVTFAPCFLWILLGAPYVERLLGNRALTMALSTVTAAVVGVILNLALWFGLHMLFADHRAFSLGPLDMELPVPASLDPLALLLAAAAMIALMRFKWGVLPTLAGCAVAGAALQVFVRG